MHEDVAVAGAALESIAPSGGDVTRVRRAGLPGAVASLVDRIDAACRALLVLSLVGELGVVFSEIALRGLFHRSLLWADEASKLFLCSLAFVGGALAYRARQHTSVEFISERLAGAWQRRLSVAIDGAVFITSVIVWFVSLQLLSISSSTDTPILQISSAWLILPLTLGMALMVVFSAERLAFHHLPKDVLAVSAGVACIAMLGAIIHHLIDFTLSPGLALSVMLALFILSVLVGLPVGFAMLGGSLVFLVMTGVAPLIAVAQNTFDGTGNFILLTLPFFIWAGLVMEKGGISRRLVNFAMTCVGHFRGGLLQVVVLTIYMVSGISGSKIADVVAVGSVLRRELEEQGYPPEHGAAVLATSAAMSETIPPSLAMLVLGSVAPISIGTLFVAGIVPATVIASFLMALNFFLAKRIQVRAAASFSMARLARASRSAVLPLIMPVIMVVGIRFGVATPTEVSAVAVLYGVILSAVVYRALDLKLLYQIANQCCLLAGMVLFIIAAAFSFGWTLTAADLPTILSRLLHAAGDGRTAFILSSIALLIVVGSLLEGLPAIIILAPLLIPIATRLGMDPVHYSMIMILAMGVGIFIPPIGVGFSVSCAVSQSRLESTARSMLPYLAVLLAGVMVVAFVPVVTLGLPTFIRAH